MIDADTNNNTDNDYEYGFNLGTKGQGKVLFQQMIIENQLW